MPQKRINDHEGMTMAEVFSEPKQSESDKQPATIHFGDPVTLIALCGHECIEQVDSRFKPNCAICLAELAMLQDPGNGDNS